MRPQSLLPYVLLLLLLLVSSVPAFAEGPFFLDFDDDEDPYTLRTEVPAYVTEAEFRFVLEVPAEPIWGCLVWGSVTQGCCNFPEYDANYGVRIDYESLEFDPTVVASHDVAIPTCTYCCSDILTMQLVENGPYPPGTRIFFGSGIAHAICPVDPPCDVPHDFRIVFGAPECPDVEPSDRLMVMDCLDPAAVGEDLATSGSAFRLGGIFPNPVRDRTEIVVEALRSGVTSLGLYAPDGRRVATIQEGAVEPGSRRILWRAVDGAGRPLPSGVYFLRLVAPGVDSARLLIVSR